MNKYHRKGNCRQGSDCTYMLISTYMLYNPFQEKSWFLSVYFGWLVVLGFNATSTAKVRSWRSVTHMYFLAFSHQCLHNFSFQRHRLLFSQCLRYTSFENTVRIGEIARNEQFLLFPLCFLSVWRTFCHFIKFEFVVFKLFWRVQNLSFGNGWLVGWLYWGLTPLQQLRSYHRKGNCRQGSDCTYMLISTYMLYNPFQEKSWFLSVYFGWLYWGLTPLQQLRSDHGGRWRMCFLAFSHQYLHIFSFQSHRILFAQCLRYKSFENTVGKGEIALNEQFLLFQQCFLSVWRTFCHFYQIWICRLQTLSIWKCLKIVLWERVKILHNVATIAKK